jgi:FKBP-type peptidyl-prolyl cis-trans isomerase
VGGCREIKIPSVMGYGAKAVGPIPANTDLLFKVELIGLA